MDKEDDMSMIPILFKREINQDQYKKNDYQFQANLGPLRDQIKRNKDEKFVIVKILHVHPKQLILSYQKKPKNRLMAILGNDSHNNFLSISFNLYKTSKKYAQQCLKSPITINNQQYNFFGYSKSNLKQFCCYFYKASQIEITNLFNSFGNFDQIYEISKKAARLSLLYSESNFVCRVENSQIRCIQDVVREGVCFSDGCGYISRQFVRRIKGYLEEQNESRDGVLGYQYTPCVYQIRVKGIKGVLLLNPTYDQEEIIAVRKSMVKFIAKQDKLQELVLINYSKPAQQAAINQQIIMLLSGMGIDEQYLMLLQKGYLQMLKEALKDPVKNIEMLKFLGKQELIMDILQEKTNVEFKIKSVISEQIYRNIKTKDLKNRLRIPLQKARFLYGVVCPQLFIFKDKKIQLKENQIYLRVTTNKNVVETIVGKVMVTKNPCYYCGDIRILEAVDIGQSIPYFNKFVDVIIFSTEGKIPICTTISGSDYDGDEYFVCWDQNIIPKKQVKPYTYPSTAAKKKKDKVTQSDLIDYFVNFDRTIVGKINSRFLSFASMSEKGVRCRQCIQLGTQYFSRAIDSVNTGQKIYLPDNLMYPDNKIQKPKIWSKMTKQYENFFENEFKFDEQIISAWDYPYETMPDIIRTYVQSQNYNDYHLFRIIKSWYIAKKCKKYDLFKYVDFSELTVQQKRQIQDLPGFPKSLLGNPFQFSPIFNHQLFRKNGIDFHTYEERPKKWRSYYKSSGENVDFQIIEEALTKFSNFLLGIQVNENVRLVFCLKNAKTTPYTQNYLPDCSLTVYYVGNNELKKFSNASPQKYKLYYSEDLFQIYQKERANSFFWFRNNQVSIDLTRFQRDMLRRHLKITKQVIKEVEVYIGVSEDYRQKHEIKRLVVGEYVEEKMESSNEQQEQRESRKLYKQKQVSKPRPKYKQKSIEKVDSNIGNKTRKKYVQKK